ncbi:MAG: TlpA disulfide reductase family protein [Vicinamibacterales bacterium]
MSRALPARPTAALVLVGALVLGHGRADAQEAGAAGRWDATVVVNGLDVPFPFEVAAGGAGLQASFFNGERRITSTSASADGSRLTFRFDQYATTLRATLEEGRLIGEYVRARGGPLPFSAVRASAAPSATATAPSIAGTWIVQAKSNKGETAWRFLATQSGDQVEATILRVDGDTGTLTGVWRDGRFVLGHFSGARPLRLEVTPNADGTLALSQNGQPALVAAKASASRAAEIGTPTDPALHTRMKDPAEPLRFSFPDLDGHVVSHTDPRFVGKVLLVSIGGSWCPNCHDEAPFLAALYAKYRAKGLEVVGLSFEEGDQLKNPTRLRAFIQTYGLEYTFLLPGEPDELNDKMPQAENLNAFPTTFVVGRDGRVRAIHAGFPSPGSGEFYTRAEHEITELVEKLLAEPARSR